MDTQKNAPVAPNASEESRSYNRRAVILACPEADRINCGGGWKQAPSAKDTQSTEPVASNTLYAAHTKAPTTTPDQNHGESTGSKARQILNEIKKNRSTSLAISSNDLTNNSPSSDEVEFTPVSATNGSKSDEKTKVIKGIENYIERAKKKLATATAEPIRDGDALRVKVAGHEELDKKVIIPPAGTFSYNLISDFNVLGKSLADLTKEVATRLSTYILNAQVSIRRVNIIKVLGYTNKSGQFEFNYEPNILDVITMAGGLNTLDSKYSNYRARIISNDGKVFELDVTDLLDTGIGASQVRLFHGDTLIITPDEGEKIYVMGSANVSLLYRHGMKLLDALSLASGEGRNATPESGIRAEEFINIKNLRVLRKAKDGHTIKIVVNMHDLIHQGRTDRNITLMPGDYVILPKRSQRKDAIKVISDGISPLYQTIGFYSLVRDLNN